eukprot:scpid12894/ scgid4081/ Tight junction protein ZO-1; Tight junction protein 1; Zona occludens protein 1; Zonula occludens protein 1
MSGRDSSLSALVGPTAIRVAGPATSESSLKRDFLARHREELITELAAAWHHGAPLRFLEFLKTHGDLSPFESETIVGAGQSRHRAEALVSIILAREDVCSLWQALWKAVQRFAPSMFKTFHGTIEQEIGYFAVDVVYSGSTGGRSGHSLHRPPIDARGNLAVCPISDGLGSDIVSGHTGVGVEADGSCRFSSPFSLPVGSAGRAATCANDAAAAAAAAVAHHQAVNWETMLEQHREERDTARHERGQALDTNFRLTKEIHEVREANEALRESVAALEAANSKLQENNAQLTVRNSELQTSVESIHANHRRQLESTQTAVQQLLVMQDQEKKRQEETLTYAYRIQEQEAKILNLTALHEKASEHVNIEQQKLSQARSEMERTRRELEETRQRLTGSIPLKCVKFTVCNHSIADSGVQSESSGTVNISNERPVMFLKEVDLDIQLPPDADLGGGIVADRALVIKEITNNSSKDNGQLLVGDEVREVNGDVCATQTDFKRILSDSERSSALNVSVRRRLVLSECGSCSQPGTAGRSGPLMNSPVSTVASPMTPYAKRLASVAPTLPPVPVSPNDAVTVVTSTAMNRPDSSAGMCAVSSSSCTAVRHKTEVGAQLSSENLPAELSDEGDDDDNDDGSDSVVLPAITVTEPTRSGCGGGTSAKGPLRTVRLQVDELRAPSYQVDGNKRMTDRFRSASIPHLSTQSISSQRRRSEPQVPTISVTQASNTVNLILPGMFCKSSSSRSAMSQSSDVMAHPKSKGCTKIDRPLRLTDAQLKRIGAGHAHGSRREIALHYPRTGDTSFGLDVEEWGLVGGRGCGTFIKSAPDWVMEHGVKMGDRILFVQSKDVQDAPLELTQYWIDNTVAFSEIVHIVVETDEDGYNKVNSGKAKENFYVRANFNYLATRPDQLCIANGDILHIHDTMPEGRIGAWMGCKILHYKDTERIGGIPCPKTARSHVTQMCHQNNTTSTKQPSSTAATTVATAADSNSTPVTFTPNTTKASGQSTKPAKSVSVPMSAKSTPAALAAARELGAGPVYEETTGARCSPLHTRGPAVDDDTRSEDDHTHRDNSASGGNGKTFVHRALHVFGIRGNQRRRGSKTVTQIMDELSAGHHVCGPTPPYEYIELIAGARVRPVVLFGSMTHVILRELEKLYPSYYGTCTKTYYKTLAERNRRVEHNELVYSQSIETQEGFESITIDAVREVINRGISPLLDSDISCIRRLQSHGQYAVTICLKPMSKSSLKSFLETLCGRPFMEDELTAEISAVKASYEAYKHILTDVLEIKGRCNKDFIRLHRVIQNNLRNPSWVSSIDQPDYFCEPSLPPGDI